MCQTHLRKLKKITQGTRAEISILEGWNATDEANFNATIKELEAKVPKAAEAFLSKRVHHFYKTFISIILKCDNVDNNIVETFNGYICKIRTMHLIWILEDIRTLLREMMHNKVNMMLKYNDMVCPRIRKCSFLTK